MFENDVKVDGTQTDVKPVDTKALFENDVKVDGTQTNGNFHGYSAQFENDVKVDGTQTICGTSRECFCLRMM